MRRCVALLLCLAGCGDTLFADLVTRLPEVMLQEAEPDQEPDGKALRVWVGGRASTAVLLSETGQRRLWRTRSGVAVATDGGRVVATAGLRQWLAATRFDGPDPLQDAAALLERPADARRMVDLMHRGRDPEDMRFGVQVRCTLTAARTADAAVVLVEERCRATGAAGWLEGAGRFTNRFWVETEGNQVLRSEQWVGPGVPMLALEVL